MDKTFKTKLGLRIKELRVANKLTQEALSEMLNMERSNLARIESGKQFPNPENLEKLTQIFNITYDELFNFGHLKSRKDLVEEIIDVLNSFDEEKIRYIYKACINLKNV